MKCSPWFAGASVLTVPALASGQSAQPLPSPYPYPEPAWSPYWVGAGIGVLVMLTLSLSKKPVGASSAYSDLSGIIGRLIAPRHTGSSPCPCWSACWSCWKSFSSEMR